MNLEWKERVKYALAHQKEIEEKRLKREKKEFYKKLRKYVSVPILIGIFAAYFLWHQYGKDELIKVMLGWIIGLTLVATIMAYLPKNIQK
ncbi:2TM domain-containing protein [Candidatus Woesearchaeota archaeon]|nr:2TM domain-containing protein [Candidatus Woesearchaeota archaeon]